MTGTHAYESGYFFDFSVVGRGLTQATPFTGTFIFTRVMHQQWKAAHSAKSKWWVQLKNSVAQVYGNWPNPGIEYNAGCVANSWSKNSYWAYGGQDRCGGAQQKLWTRAIAKGTVP